VTGGTGLYLRALTEGLFAGPERQEELRARLQAKRRSTEALAASLLRAAGCGDGERAFTRTTRPS
jgi:tRNA dimethylallyltransferase